MMSVGTILPALAPMALSGMFWTLTTEKTEGSLAVNAQTSPEPPAVVNSRQIPWWISFGVDADRLASLQPGWDGPGSVAINKSLLQLARMLATSALAGNRNPLAPSLSPAGDGSLQLEWHSKEGELELLIETGCDFSIWGCDHRNGLEFEGSGPEALNLFYRWASWLAAPKGDALDVLPSSRAIELEFAA